jgi:putative heme-binding domain-containing protein
MTATLLVVGATGRSEDADTLAPLVQLLSESEDPQLQLDVLRGMSDGLKGQRALKAPEGWHALEKKLAGSPDAQIRDLVKSLSLTFGSSSALASLRETLSNPKADFGARTNALNSLLLAKDTELAPVLQHLTREPMLRGAAIRGLAVFEDAKTPEVVLGVYSLLTVPEQKDALNTLASRSAYARVLAAALSSKKIPARDLTADLVRQLRAFNDPQVNDAVDRLWGVARESGEDKKQEIAKYKALLKNISGSDTANGRAVFARICQQCHTLFGEGGKVGPDITGSNRADLDYILETVVDPNAVIPNDYRTSTIQTKDERVITGIITRQDDNSLSVVTANETLLLSRGDVESIQHSEFSMMPDGLIQSLTDGEVRDLIAYLRSPAQVPLAKQ